MLHINVPFLDEPLEVKEDGTFELPARDDYTPARLREIARYVSKAAREARKTDELGEDV